MRIKYNDTDYIPPLVNHILQPLVNMGISLNKSFPDLFIYLGEQPEFEKELNNSKWAANIRRPHFTEHEGNYYVVVKDLWKGFIPQQAIMNTIAHEIGHYIHTTYLGEDMSKWLVWAAETEHELDLTFKNDNGYPRKKSYEAFANDFAKITTQGFSKYYIDLLKGVI